MNTENIPLAAVFALCATVFLLIGCWAARRREPMHFWSGTKVDPASIRDVPAYNCACARLWWGCGAVWLLTAAGVLCADWSGALLMAVAFGSLPVLVIVYCGIRKKYAR